MSSPVKTAALAFVWILVGALQCGVAWAEPIAVLKVQVKLDAGVITVADLWGNAGAKAKMVIGMAPPPGRSIAIEAAQLTYIAQLYDVAWRPTSGVERISIERAGRPLTRDEMSDPIRRGLVEAGASPAVTIELSNFTPVLVPPLSFPTISIEALSFDPAAERFSAAMAIETEGMPTERMRVAGRVLQLVSAVVATRRLSPTDVIGPGDVRAVKMPERRLSTPGVTDIADVLGQMPKRTIVAGQALGAGDVGPPVMVAKGATVVLVLETPTMSMMAQGLAMGAGGRDDMIQVMNPVSRAVVAARVTSAGRAVIVPGSVPLVAPQRATPRGSEVAN